MNRQRLKSHLRHVADLFLDTRSASISFYGKHAVCPLPTLDRNQMDGFRVNLNHLIASHVDIKEVHVHPSLQRVIFSFRDRRPDPDELTRIVTVATSQIPSHTITDPKPNPPAWIPPDDPDQTLQMMLETAADGAAVLTGSLLKTIPGLSGLCAFSGKNLFSAFFLASHIPAVRQRIEHRLGLRRTELLFHLTRAFSLGLAQYPLTSLVTFLNGVDAILEQRERSKLWTSAADDIISQNSTTDIPMPQPRPVPLHNGPIEQYERHLVSLATGAAVFALLTTGNPLRMLPAAFAALPDAARQGRLLFTGELGRIFASRKMLILQSGALKHLDRVDCLLIPAEMLFQDHFAIASPLCTVDLSAEDAIFHAESLFHPRHPLRLQKSGSWTLGPLPLVVRKPSSTIRKQIETHENRGALLLGLTQSRRLCAVFDVRMTRGQSLTRTLQKAARLKMNLFAIGHQPISPAEHPEVPIRGFISLTQRPDNAIRALQQAGHTVCLLGNAPADAVMAADFSIVIRGTEPMPLLCAHVISPDHPNVLDTVLEACAAARRISRQGTNLSMLSATLGTLAAASGRSRTAATRSHAIVSLASLISMSNAYVRTRHLTHPAIPDTDPTPFQALTPNGALSLLQTHASSSSSSKPTHTGNRQQRGLLQAITRELSNPLTPLLGIGAGISAVVGSKADAAIIATVTLINGLIGGGQRYRAERRLSQLTRSSEKQVEVIRDSVRVACVPQELQIGDRIRLSRGETVPADCRILEALDLEVNTAALTGETFPVMKTAAPSFAENVADMTSMLFEGNHISNGTVDAVVTAIGEQTVMARASAISSGDRKRGGIESHLSALMQVTGPVTIAAGAALMGVGLLRGKRIEELTTSAVGLAVAAVPEGLPLLATIAQLSSAARLSRKGALVKNPAAVEAMGRMTTLCVDKTGTLTEGTVSLQTIYTGDERISPHSSGNAGFEIMTTAACTLLQYENAPMDAINTAIRNALAENLPDIPKSNQLSALPFDSTRGFEAAIVVLNSRKRLVLKGTPEWVLSRSTFIRSGTRKRLCAQTRQQFESVLQTFAREGLRVIAVAEKVLTPQRMDRMPPREQMENPEGLTLLGLLAFHDPIRPDAEDIISQFADLGIHTRMLTGDHPETAVTVARATGIRNPDILLTGNEIQSMTDADLDAAVATTHVFARISPYQKARIVRSLSRSSEVVGMVGDGTNDAPAMRAADAGIAMGLHSTEAARCAADVILTGTTLHELHDMVIEGRAMWRSVRHAVSILVGGNLGEVAFAVAAGALTGRSPLTPRQLLVINFLTDIAPSTAIALRPPDVIDRTHTGLPDRESPLGFSMNREIAARAICTAGGAMSAWTLASLLGDRTGAGTVALLALVGSQLGQTLLTGGKHASVIATGVGSAALLGIMVQTPGISHLLGCRPLGPMGWSLAIGTSIGSTLMSERIETLLDQLIYRWRLLPDDSVRKQIIRTAMSEFHEMAQMAMSDTALELPKNESP